MDDNSVPSPARRLSNQLRQMDAVVSSIIQSYVFQRTRLGFVQPKAWEEEEDGVV